MSDSAGHSTDDTLARRVVQRLTAPGVVDRGALRQARDRLAPTRSSALVDRLQRRAAATQVSGALPLARAARTAPADGEENAAPALTRASVSDGSTASTPIVSLQAAPGAIVARRARGDAPAGDAGAIRSSSGAAPSPVVQRRTADTASGAGRARVTVASSHAPSSRDFTLAGQSGGNSPDMRGVENRSTATASTDGSNHVQRATLPFALVARKPDAGASRATDAQPSVGGPSLSPIASSAPLVLRKSNAAASTTGGTPATAATTTSAVTTPLVARSATTSSHHAPAAARPTQHALDLDWVAEQVGQRIARRLEIERERLGVRSWRP